MEAQCRALELENIAKANKLIDHVNKMVEASKFQKVQEQIESLAEHLEVCKGKDKGKKASQSQPSKGQVQPQKTSRWDTSRATSAETGLGFSFTSSTMEEKVHNIIGRGGDSDS